MKETVINAIIQHHRGNLSAKDAIVLITNVFFPTQVDQTLDRFTIRNITHLKKIIMFLFDVPEELLTTTTIGRAQKASKDAKTLFRALIRDLFPEDSLEDLCDKLSINAHRSLLVSFQQHRDLIDTDPEYRNIYITLKQLIKWY
jgi:hypothetical protein